MESLASEQARLGKEIEKIIKAYNEQSPDRKTISYLEERLTAVEELWERFEANDDKIRDITGVSLDHPYFHKDYHRTVKIALEKFKTEITSLIEYVKTQSFQEANTSSKDEHALVQNSITKVENPELSRQLKKHQALKVALKHLIANTTLTENQSLEYLLSKKAKVAKTWADIENCHYAIWELVEDIYASGYNLEEYFDLQNQSEALLINLECHIKKVEASSNVTMTKSESQLKLPKIELPKFDGEYIKWPQFADLFKQMVHDQPIGNCQKFWYLKMNLTGEAAKLVMHLPISNGNYIVAWDTLNNRYANKRLLVNALLDKLMAQSTITTESASALKSLHDTTKECLFTLQTIGIAAREHWDPIIVHTVLKKLDKTSYTLYEQTLNSPRELPSLDDLLKFIEMRFQTLETLNQRSGPSKQSSKPAKQTSLVSSKTSNECKLCKNSHAIYHCEAFLKLSPVKRNEKARELDLCTNCLRKGHGYKKCMSRGCQKCGKKHNTLLHNQPLTTPTPKDNQSSSLSVQSKESDGYVLLGTAVAEVDSKEGKPIRARVLLDSGSQLNFITDKLRKRLGFPIRDTSINISGIGNTKVKANDKINITLKSTCKKFSTVLEVFSISDIANNQPQQYIDTTSWNIPENIQLADPSFNKPGRIDILLGAEIYGEIIRNGQIRLSDNLPILQNTTLGWIMLGKVSNRVPFCGVSNINLERQLQKFWELEECSGPAILSSTDKTCEEFFEATTSRDNTGRFTVNLPLLGDASLLGDSETLAYKRLLAMEKRLSTQPILKKQYNQFLQEYLDLGHMEETSKAEIIGPHYFMPHHYVLKPESSTTKLRVVFDASAKTKNNLSLNDLLVKGPKVQEDISTIITRFRLKRYVFTADITKMYRQIRMAEEDQQLQLIMWKQDGDKEVRYFKLTTVTYGTKAAPYLAIKCLKKLADEGANQFPLGAAAIQDFYVDDVLTGSDSLAEAITMRDELKSLLASAGFNLHKWCANHPQLVHGIANQNLDIKLDVSTLDSDSIKTLGLIWQPTTDMFTLVTTLKEHKSTTKRSILADISQIFDPLGLVSPVIVTGKLFMQNLWKSKVDWDEAIPEELELTWSKYREELRGLNEIYIPRYIFSDHETIDIQMHAFADASLDAFGTAVYIRSKDKRGKVTVKLLCAKSRVAPIKPTRIPRLELCAAKLAAKLVKQVKSSTKIKVNATFYWSDSLIVINWIRGDPSIRKTFVANRVASIQDMTSTKEWLYVPTKDNPADLVSRGLFPNQLRRSEIWFDGPKFLKLPKSSWPAEPNATCEDDEETKINKIAAPATTEFHTHPLYSIDHRNSFQRLLRVMAYINRALICFKNKGLNRESCYLSTEELNTALKVIVREVQRNSFQDELVALRNGQEVPKSSRLRTLAPFKPTDNIIRVGGRLRAAEINYDAKHPMVLPDDHFVTRLLLTYLHQVNLHAGPQALQNIARQKYWILNGRNICRTVVANCVLCTKFRPNLMGQQMGDLPKNRVRLTRAFLNSGVDFCGPIYTHFKIRGKRPQKSYLAVFICFATKAIHLEVVSDLTTDGFLNALKRFESRRGRCENIYCDNARNFVGANNQLHEVKDILTQPNSVEKIMNSCTNANVQFHFIPPRSPHFGGLWEAAVKSTKFLLQRTVASASLTYEELCTVAAEVEAILNSRPLTPLSSDPNDLTPLTPAHFLIGEPFAGTNSSTSETGRMSLASRWQLTNQLRKEFWQRWYMEYLGELQKRTKWLSRQNDIKTGTVVTIKEDNLPPFKWKLGRIIETIKGGDGRVRVADVQTASGIIRRSIHQLAPLPVDFNGEEFTDSYENTVTNVEPMETTETVATSYRAHRKRKRSPSKIGSLKSLLLTLLVLPLLTGNSSSASELPIEVTEINNNGGIYFENIGQGQLSPKSWKIISFCDLKGYWEIFQTIDAGVQQLERLKNDISNNTYHDAIVKQYHHRLQQLTQDNVILQEPTQMRKRRSPFDIIGSLANKLFGVLDSEYEQTMSKTIASIKSNEKYMSELIKRHTSILETTSNIIMKGEALQRNQSEQIRKAFDAIYENIRFFNSEVKQQRIIEAFNTLSILVMSLINECQDMQHALVDMILDAHHERIHPNVISPQQMKVQAALIKENLPQELEIPTSSHSSVVTRIYQIMQIQYHNEHGCLVFILSIPLVLITKFHLLRAPPLPTLLNNTFVYMSTGTEIIMTNIFKDQFYLLHQTELIQCKNPDLDYYICSQQKPIIHKSDKINDCIVELLASNKLLPNCVFKQEHRNKVWHQLKRANTWLFSMAKTFVFACVCENHLFQQRIQGKGVINMRPGCILKDDEFTLKAFDSRQSSLNASLFPKINVSIEAHPSIVNSFPPLPSYHINRVPLDVDTMKKQVKELTLKQAELHNIQSESTHTIAVSYSALGVILIAIVWLVFQHQRKLRATMNKKPVPAPRQSIHDLRYNFEV